jgi:hypothetical protein
MRVRNCYVGLLVGADSRRPVGLVGAPGPRERDDSDENMYAGACTALVTACVHRKGEKVLDA